MGCINVIVRNPGSRHLPTGGLLPPAGGSAAAMTLPPNGLEAKQAPQTFGGRVECFVHAPATEPAQLPSPTVFLRNVHHTVSVIGTVHKTLMRTAQSFSKVTLRTIFRLWYSENPTESARFGMSVVTFRHLVLPSLGMPTTIVPYVSSRV